MRVESNFHFAALITIWGRPFMKIELFILHQLQNHHPKGTNCFVLEFKETLTVLCDYFMRYYGYSWKAK